MDDACSINREQYLCDQLKGKTHAQAYPQLLKGGAPFDSNDFDLKRILKFLSKGNWVRKASLKGVISFFNQSWNLTTKHKRQYVYVHLEEESNEWVVSLDKATEVKRFPNDFITNEKILNLEVSE